ncbi:hypothetical protein [Amycolatopsis thermoflava]|uniref:hypothetical protein n=1 Tax=Amycolatopsis thermoflava TaxID=84480 RepID=UPI00380A26CA
MAVAVRLGKPAGKTTARRWIVVVLWAFVAAAIAVRLSVMFAQPIRPGESFRGAEGYFLDFRDTVWTPGRDLLSGENPYDPDTYLATYPWALPMSLYTPAWLTLAVPLAPLPYLFSVALFQVLSIGVAVVMLRILAKWSMPLLADFAVPLGLLWCNIWYPGRGAISVQLGSLLGVLGAVLILRSLATAKPGAGWGVALVLIKVQFGVFALAAAVGGRLRSVWRGVLWLAVASVPVVVACTIAAGGPAGFVRSVLRDLAVLSSDVAPTGLSNPVQRRFDLLGQLARWGLTEPPAWLQIAVPLLAVVAVVFVVRATRRPLTVAAGIATAMLIGFYHAPYDLLVLFVPVALGIGMAVRGELTRTADRVAVDALTLVVLHLHTVSTKLIPGFDVRLADAVDLLLVAVGLAAALVSSRCRGAR